MGFNLMIKLNKHLKQFFIIYTLRLTIYCKSVHPEKYQISFSSILHKPNPVFHTNWYPRDKEVRSWDFTDACSEAWTRFVVSCWEVRRNLKWPAFQQSKTFVCFAARPRHYCLVNPMSDSTTTRPSRSQPLAPQAAPLAAPPELAGPDESDLTAEPPPGHSRCTRRSADSWISSIAALSYTCWAPVKKVHYQQTFSSIMLPQVPVSPQEL